MRRRPESLDAALAEIDALERRLVAMEEVATLMTMTIGWFRRQVFGEAPGVVARRRAEAAIEPGDALIEAANAAARRLDR